MKLNNKLIHIVIIIIGIVFISLGAFHTNIWFDESYSVAIANHSFKEIWTIGGNDVHPVLYYWMLKIVSLIFGNSILAYRLFSVIGIAILGILGFTHIRKDFGEETGIIFSFLSFFLPVMTIYAVEIRMYSWTAVFVTLAFIYAYRLLKNNDTKNWIIFGIFSLCSCYMHYYGLMAAGIINLSLFIYILKNKKENLKKFIFTAIPQIILYVPWLIYFVKQLKHVSNGFWIGFEFPKTFIEIFQFQYLGNLNSIVANIFMVSIYLYIGYIIYRKIKEKEDIKPGITALGLYLLIIIAATIISIKSPILYYRYMFTVTGVLIIFLSFFMAKEKNKYITLGICVCIIILSTISNIRLIKENYDSTNYEPINYLKENIRKGDIFFYSDIINNGATVATKFTDIKQYFYNKDHWDIEEAYKAYSPQMETVESFDILKDYKGRIWLIDSENLELYNSFPKEYIKELKEIKNFNMKYKGYIYNFVLIEK